MSGFLLDLFVLEHDDTTLAQTQSPTASSQTLDPHAPHTNKCLECLHFLLLDTPPPLERRLMQTNNCHGRSSPL